MMRVFPVHLLINLRRVILARLSYNNTPLTMSEVSQVLDAISRGNARVVNQFVPLVYAELRWLAAAGMANEPAGQTLQHTALVHEACLRLVDSARPQSWDGAR